MTTTFSLTPEQVEQVNPSLADFYRDQLQLRAQRLQDEKAQQEISFSLRIGNRVEPVPDSETFRWTVFVDGDLANVASVEFRLHPTFHPALVTLTEVCLHAVLTRGRALSSFLMSYIM